jgi:hypothetical protein
MDMDELIRRLVALKVDYGNARVEVRNPAGEFDEVAEVTAEHYGHPNALHWIVYLDT